MSGEILNFEIENGFDVYNPTAPFIDNNELYIAARVEARDDELNSKVMFFKEDNCCWILDKSKKTYNLQDPFITRVNKELIFGGVKVSKCNKGLNYKTVFYKGDNINNLEEFAEGPEKMKDIRLIELPDKKIGVFTRPQGGVYGKGEIGFMKINSLNSLNSCDFYKAKIIKDFNKSGWGGVNEVQYLENNLVGVLGHVATSELKDGLEMKHYASMAFTFNYMTMEATPLKIIATRDDFPKCDAKRAPEFNDVIFTGGLRKINNKKVELYVGLGDVEIGRIILPNPFYY